MQIIKYGKIYFFISCILMLASLAALLFFGLKLGIDFTGGTLMEVEFSETRPDNREIQEKLTELPRDGQELGHVNIQPTGERGVILKLRAVNEDTHQAILAKLGKPEEKRFESIGSLIGGELKKKAFWAIVLALLAIIAYIAWVFRKVSRPVASWQYAIVALIALFHDVFITLGFFCVFAHFTQIEIGLPFVAAFLTILGYSINNSIVVFDRARENLLRSNWDNFGEVINQSINQSLTRCLNTSLTTLFVLLAIFFLGGESVKYFALALIVGIIIGAYSSIFIISPLVVLWEKRKK
ncbi:MAG: protein translocase subunit SecF [Patescibacteria group bacterium]|nr:protein translocase subunit SecF [Patescibacteria group bacterium]